MKKEFFIAVCQAAYGENFVTPVSKFLRVSDRTVRHWITGKYTIPAIESELLQPSEHRKREIQDSIAQLQKAIRNKNMTVINIAYEVNDEIVSKIEALLEQKSLHDVNWNGVNFVIERDNFTCIDDENESYEHVDLLHEINQIIAGC